MAVETTLDAPLVFRAFIQNNVQYALSRLPDDDNAVPDPEERQMMLQALDFALEHPDAWPATRELVVTLAPRMEQAGYREEWLGYLRRGIEQSQEHGDLATEAELRLQFGILLQLLSQYAEARREMTLCLQQFQQVGDDHGRARALNRLAYVLRREGERERAEAMAQQALELLADGDPERGYCHLVFGAIRLDERQWQAAATHFQSALDIWQKSAGPRLRGWGHSNLGLALWRLGEHAAAAEHFAIAIELFRHLGDPVHAAVTTMNLGSVLLSTDQSDEALGRYLSARPVFRQAQDLTRLGILESNIGMAYRQLGRPQRAEAAYHASIQIWQKLGNSIKLANAAGGLAQVYLDQGRYKDAATVLHRAIALLPEIEEEHSRAFFSEALFRLLEQAEEGLQEA